jgi:CheY-like chemotaxis protein
MTKRPDLSQESGAEQAPKDDRSQNQLTANPVSQDRGAVDCTQEDVKAAKEAAPTMARDKGDALTRLANDISHDFNNLITSILGNAEALRQRFEGTPSAHAEIATIRGEAQRAASILRRLTSVSDEALLTTPVTSEPPLPSGDEKLAGDANGVGEVDADLAVRPTRVLLAEDDASVRRIVALTLRKNGYEVTACATGEEAWQVFAKSPSRFDLLITDLSMPVLDGASLIQRVRLLHPRLRALLISGYCDDRQAFDLVKSGAVGFLPKPFNTNEFLSFVRGHMEAA